MIHMLLPIKYGPYDLKLYLSGITGRRRLDIHYNRLRKQEVMAKNDSSYSARLMALDWIHNTYQKFDSVLVQSLLLTVYNTPHTLYDLSYMIYM